jgi:hypothetical protein
MSETMSEDIMFIVYQWVSVRSHFYMLSEGGNAASGKSANDLIHNIGDLRRITINRKFMISKKLIFNLKKNWSCVAFKFFD